MSTLTPHERLSQFEAGWSPDPVESVPLPQWIESFDSDVEADAFVATCLQDRAGGRIEQRGREVYLLAGPAALVRQCQDLARGWIAHREELRLARERLHHLEGPRLPTGH